MSSFVPRNHPQQTKACGADDETDDRRTPDAIFLPLQAEHGFTIDVASNATNRRCERHYDRAADGLAQSWRGEVVWCNPPYSDLRTWVHKSLAEVDAGGCRKVVLLLPANRTEQAWWQDLIEPVRDRGLGVTTRNLRGRPKFETPTGAPIKGATGWSQTPFGCVVVIIEPCAARAASAA